MRRAWPTSGLLRPRIPTVDGNQSIDKHLWHLIALLHILQNHREYSRVLYIVVILSRLSLPNASKQVQFLWDQIKPRSSRNKCIVVNLKFPLVKYKYRQCKLVWSIVSHVSHSALVRDGVLHLAIQCSPALASPDQQTSDTNKNYPQGPWCVHLHDACRENLMRQAKLSWLTPDWGPIQYSSSIQAEATDISGRGTFWRLFLSLKYFEKNHLTMSWRFKGLLFDQIQRYGD